MSDPTVGNVAEPSDRLRSGTLIGLQPCGTFHDRADAEFCYRGSRLVETVHRGEPQFRGAWAVRPTDGIQWDV